MSRDTPTDLIDPDPGQPRRYFDQAEVDELAQSLAADGLVSPIMVRPSGSGRFLIVHGERRWRAARSLGWDTIPAVVRDVDPADVPWIQLVENVQRCDLTPLEEAQGYRQLVDAGHTQAEVAARIGKTRTYVAQKLRLLDLPAPLAHFLKVSALTEGHMRQLLRLRKAYGTQTVGAHVAEQARAAVADETFADPPIALVSVKVGARPLDWPPLYHWNTPDGMAAHAADVASKLINSMCDPDFPNWAITATWFGLASMCTTTSVADLGRAIDLWFKLIVSAWLDLLGYDIADIDVASNRYSYVSDLRHAGLLDHRDALPDRLPDLVPATEDDIDGVEILYPSTFQPWAPRHGEYDLPVGRS